MKHSSNNQKTVYIVISVLGGVIALAALVGILFLFVQSRRAQDEYARLSQAVHFSPAPTDTAETPSETALPEATAGPTPEPTPVPTPEPAVIPIDFAYLQSLNSDIVGWITVDGTDIDYPVLYDTSSDMYYLDHNHQGTYTQDGAIFMQDYNDWDFSDFNTLLYGHNTGTGMFTQLHRFEDETFFNEYDTIVIYTSDRKLTYRIFAAYERDDRNILYYYDFSTPEYRRAYIDEIYTHEYGLYDRDVPVSDEDRILSLSTCTGYLYTRYIVQGVLISNEPGVYAGDES